MHASRPSFFAFDDPSVQALRERGFVWREVDLLQEQWADLAEARSVGAEDEDEARKQAEAALRAEAPGQWVYYPWSGTLVRMLGKAAFRELRLDRNRDKITASEQRTLLDSTVGVVGLSVGNAVALTLAQEGVVGCLRLADFDVLGTSNLNRVRAAVADVGLPKTVVAARQIAEIDPYVEVQCFGDGLTDDNLEAFIGGLDVLVDECDGLGMKLTLRKAARARRLPVVMETSDRGTLDVERFDEEPDRVLLHGRVPDIDPAAVADYTDGERLALVAQMVGYDVSTRAAASMLEIGATLSTWPQLASDVALGGATVCAAVRRILLGQPLASGRRYVDLGARLQDIEADPVEAQVRSAPEELPTGAPALHVDLVRGAVMAPSGGNCQPWHFVSDGDTLTVHHLRERSASLLDVDGFAGLVSVGAAIEGLALAASERGQRLVVEYTGAGEGAVAVARCEASTDAPDPLASWLGRRFTDRRNPERRALGPADLGALMAEVAAPVGLELVSDDDGRAELGRHIGAIDRVRFLHPQLHQEMWEEVRWTEADALARPDGISLGEMAVEPGDVPVLRLLSRPDVAAFLRREQRGSRLGDLAEDWVRSASAVGLVSCAHTDPASLLGAGRAIHRVWLAACARGYAVQPIGVAAYMIRHLGTELEAGYLPSDLATLRAGDQALKEAFPGAASEHRLLLFRILTGGDRYASKSRRPLNDVLSVT